jgi:hypothetical protein
MTVARARLTLLRMMLMVFLSVVVLTAILPASARAHYTPKVSRPHTCQNAHLTA